MYSKASLSSMGLPHSGHSGGVRGRSALSMVLSTSEGDLGYHRAPELRGLVHHCPHEGPARAGTGNGDPSLRSVPLVHQVVGRRRSR